MDRDERARAGREWVRTAAKFTDPRGPPEQRLRGGRAEADDDARGRRPRLRSTNERTRDLEAFGLSWMRRFPTGCHLKCFTAFVR
jgi:hypothetical protein